MSISKFIWSASMIALALMAVSSLAVSQLGWPYEQVSMIAAILVALFPTFVAYSLTYMGLDKDTTRFVGYLAVGMFGKMLIGILSIVLVAVQFKEVRDEYVVTYIIAYFTFTSFEVYGLIRRLRPKF